MNVNSQSSEYNNKHVLQMCSYQYKLQEEESEQNNYIKSILNPPLLLKLEIIL